MVTLCRPMLTRVVILPVGNFWKGGLEFEIGVIGVLRVLKMAESTRQNVS
jgi:hypothetical protein